MQLKIKTTLIYILTLISTFHLKSQQLPKGFVYLDDFIEDIVIDLRYYSSNNFMGDTINGYLSQKCIITRKAAKALKNVQKDLKKHDVRIKIFDAYRPQRAVNHFIEWKDLPDNDSIKERYYPDFKKADLFKNGYIATRSGHSRGSTVDLTLINSKGEELDMGTRWDFFSKLSWPDNTDISKAQYQNRMLLRKSMINNGFKPLKEEWWHFTLKKEPFPDTYFDFAIE
ncbi:MAG: M15 family metallopeptidase [Cyclobacteriaceae bacterium]